MTALLVAVLLLPAVGALGLVGVAHLRSGADLRSLRRYGRVWATWYRWSEPVE